MKTSKLFFAFLTGLLLILSGCSKEYPEDILNETAINDQQELFDPLTNYTFSGELPEATSHLKGALVTKTLKFKRASGVFHAFDPGLTGVPQLYISGQGIASHLGKFSVINNIVFTGGDQNGDGEPDFFILGIITAANGDELHSALIGVEILSEDGMLREFTYMVYMGTGRFEGVVGTITLRGLIDYANGSWSLSGEGEITY